MKIGDSITFSRKQSPTAHTVAMRLSDTEEHRIFTQTSKNFRVTVRCEARP